VFLRFTHFVCLEMKDLSFASRKEDEKEKKEEGTSQRYIYSGDGGQANLQ